MSRSALEAAWRRTAASGVAWFRDWAAEKTDHLREVVEAALAHTVHNQVEAAYRRSDLFERRRGLMKYWEAYVAGESWDPEAGRIR